MRALRVFGRAALLSTKQAGFVSTYTAHKRRRLACWRCLVPQIRCRVNTRRRRVSGTHLPAWRAGLAACSAAAPLDVRSRRVRRRRDHAVRNLIWDGARGG